MTKILSFACVPPPACRAAGPERRPAAPAVITINGSGVPAKTIRAAAALCGGPGQLSDDRFLKTRSHLSKEVSQ